MTVNQKVYNNIVFDTSRSMCSGYFLESPIEAILTNIKNICYMRKWEKKNKPFVTYHSAVFKDPLQQQISFDGNI